MPYSVDLKALYILRQNVRDLLLARKESEAWLAQCLGFKHRSSLNKFLNSERAGFQMSRLDKMAAFFGLPVYQLFQPGISAVTERRTGVSRRSGRDRRVGHAHRQAAGLRAAIEPLSPPSGKAPHAASSSPLADIRRIMEDAERKVSALISRAESGGQAPVARRQLPTPPKSSGTVRGSDPAED